MIFLPSRLPVNFSGKSIHYLREPEARQTLRPDLHTPAMPTLRVDIWSDIACPWCYIGKRRLEAALARFPHRDAVEVVWRAFELDPSAPRLRDTSVSYAERLARKYGTAVPQA